MAWLFDGIDDYATLAPDAALALGDGGWTMGGWVTRDNNVDALAFLFGWYTGSGPRCYSYLRGQQYASNPGSIDFHVYDSAGNGISIVSTGTYGLSTAWRHVLYTVTAGGVATIYLDGASIGTGTNANLGEIDVADTFKLGSRYTPQASRYWTGGMAEWAKWDRVLAAGEIAALVAGAAPRNVPAGLAWYLPMLDYQEHVAGLMVANHGSTLVDHPPQIVSVASRRVARAEVFVAQAAAAKVFTPGIVAGQAHVH